MNVIFRIQKVKMVMNEMKTLGIYASVNIARTVIRQFAAGILARVAHPSGVGVGQNQDWASE